MSPRTALPLLACAALAAPALAQEQAETEPRIDYNAGQYEYAEVPSPDDGDDVVTITPPEPTAPLPAARVIPVRRTAPAPMFVSQPVVQPIAPAQPVQYVQTATTPTPAAAIATPVYYTAPVQTAAPVVYAYPAPAATVYAYPSGGASRVIYPSGDVAPAYAQPRAYATTPAALPPGARLVLFESATWLAECRARLAGYPPEARDAVIAALGGAAAGHTPGRDHCEAYLDSYFASAAAGTLAGQTPYGGQYMLVPVTVVQPPVVTVPAE